MTQRDWGGCQRLWKNSKRLRNRKELGSVPAVKYSRLQMVLVVTSGGRRTRPIIRPWALYQLPKPLPLPFSLLLFPFREIPFPLRIRPLPLRKKNRKLKLRARGKSWQYQGKLLVTSTRQRFSSSRRRNLGLNLPPVVGPEGSRDRVQLAKDRLPSKWIATQDGLMCNAKGDESHVRRDQACNLITHSDALCNP